MNFDYSVHPRQHQSELPHPLHPPPTPTAENVKTYHGIEGVLSHDHGQTWDWQNRFIIFRWLPGEGVHSPISVQLADGRILTVFQHDEAGRYNRNGAAGRANIGRVSMVIWSADQAQR